MQVLHDYGYNLGIAFQIVDDILDFIGNAKDVGKPVGADLAQGTVTLPAQMLLQRFQPARELPGPRLQLAVVTELDPHHEAVVG